MTTPATPFRVPVGPTPPGRGGAPAPGGPVSSGRPKSLGGILSTRQGQFGAAAAGVGALALYRHMKTKNATDSASSAAANAPANPQGTADTTQSDLYNTLEPIAEQLSGFNLSPQLAQIQAQLQAALAKTGGTTTPGTGSPAPGGPASGVPQGWTTEFHRVGVVGKGTNIADEIRSFRPNISAADLKAAEYATIINPANKALGLGRSPIIPGGAPVTFVLPQITAAGGSLHDIATHGGMRN